MSRTTRAVTPSAILLVWFVTVIVSCRDSPCGLLTWRRQVAPTAIGQYGLSMFVEKSAGSRSDGSLDCGKVLLPDCCATVEESSPDEPHPASAGSRTATLATAAPARLIARASISCLPDSCFRIRRPPGGSSDRGGR